MFSNLIESGSHAADLKRRGRFLLGTTLFYAVLLAATGVGSIYAYNVRLDSDDGEYEMLTLLRFPPAETRAAEPRREQHAAAPSAGRPDQTAVRREISVQTPYHENQIAKADTPEVRPGQAVRLGTVNYTPGELGGPVGPRNTGGTGTDTGGHDTGPAVTEAETPPPPAPPRATPTPAPRQETGPVKLTSSIISGKTLSKPAPPYPAIAKAARVQGTVAVQIVVDEQGNVISAKATSGHPLLMQAAVQAAYKARFSATFLGGQPVKVTGSITYNFVLN